MAAIQNIKILHKRYNSEQWKNGILINGETVIPMLAQGEIGLATDTLEVRIGTAQGQEQTFAQAHPISVDVITNASGKEANTVVTDIELVKDATTGKHKLNVVYGKISTDAISDFPDFAVNATNTVTAGEGEIKVVTAADENASKDHQLDVTYATAATKSYVDSVKGNLETAINNKVSAISVSDDDIIDLTKSDTDGSINIDAKHKKYNGSNTSVTAVSAGEGQEIDFDLQTVTYDAYGHVTGSTTQNVTISIPEVPTGTGDASATDTTDSKKIVTAVSLNDHTLQGTSKELVSATGSKVSVTGKSGQIEIGVDLSDYATKAELSAQISGAMHYEGVITPGASSGTATDISGLTTANGALFITTSNGYIIDSVHGIHDASHKNAVKTAIAVKQGDSIIYHAVGTDIHWDVIPAADDIEYRPIQVAGTELVGLDDSTAVNFKAGNDGVEITTNHTATAEEIIIAHKDGVAQDLTKTSRTYVDGLTFDEYGHVTGYTVGTESVEDTNTAHTHTAGAKLTISGAGGVDGSVEYGHETITTSTSADASKNKTITAGGTDNTFTVVDSVVGDGYGHITDVKTKQITVNVPEDKNDNTLYDIAGSSVEGGAQVTLTPSDTLDTASTVQFAGEDGTTVSFKNGKIVISSHDTTYELATDALAGLVKVANVLNSSASANATVLKGYTGQNNDKLYGVNRREDGTVFVEVPWTDTKYTGSNGVVLTGNNFSHATGADANLTVDLYAHGTDAYGHVTGSVAVTTIDGNYA